ncbi:MAG: hypothetical protein M1825_005019 [Sarcosagium campestre]|nr:MAG: hypothetical protein M1825_005019 [Sarcosagium campestre]
MESVSDLIASEVATLKFIRANSSIPVPEVFASSPTALNDVGVPFILMSKAPGSPLSAWTWDQIQTSKAPSRVREPRPCLTSTQKSKIMRQLGQMTYLLSRLRFDKIGSIFEEAGSFQAKTCLSMALLLHGRDQFGKEISRGPFTEECEYYTSLTSTLRLHAELLPLEHHAFFAPVPIPIEYKDYDDYLNAMDRWNDFVTLGSKIDSGKNRLDYFVLGTLLQQMVQSLAQITPAAPSGFPLSHPDLSASNIFVDDDLNVTCIIDWAFSSTVPSSMVSITPGLPHPRDNVGSLLGSAFEDGFKEEMGADLVPRDTTWDKSRHLWLLTRLVNLDSLQDFHLFSELYHLVYGVTDIPQLFRAVEQQEPFIDKRQTLAADDKVVDEIAREESEYFSHVGPERLAVSRKLKLISDMNQTFVADKKLWKWLAEALNESI